MKIVIINGTPVKGCTHQIKEAFINAIKGNHEIKEIFLPKDMPEFCCGCKTCFFKGEDKCPHAEYTMPIWNALMESELIVFAYPVYALRTPGTVKALLDHFCVHWIVHRPKEEMFSKRAAILTNSIGAPNGAAQKDVATSLAWLGVSDIRKQGFGLMEGVLWSELSSKRQDKIIEQTKRFARKCVKPLKEGRSLKIKTFFTISKMMHQGGYRKEIAEGKTPFLDNQYWAEKSWIKS